MLLSLFSHNVINTKVWMDGKLRCIAGMAQRISKQINTLLIEFFNSADKVSDDS